ncbi:MAG: ATP-dependent nuclease, partial [Candidatus Hodarchaeales archaeon]
AEYKSMKITGIELQNVRGFDKVETLIFSTKINVLVGSNNSGKSTILKSIFLLQRDGVLNADDVTIGATNGDGIIGLYFTGSHPPNIPAASQNVKNVKLELNISNSNKHIMRRDEVVAYDPIAENEPHNLIYPYLSKRKAVEFEPTINENNANSVLGDFTHLYSKIDRLANTQYQPGNSQYVKACNDILGFEVSTIVNASGKQAVLYVNNSEQIPLTAMGEGVTNIVGLITDLCVAEKRIFLIEEPENDIHPKALKALLELVASKSDTNQFFVSTHSNIVMKHLGAVPESKVFRVTNLRTDESRPKLYLSSIQEVSEDPIERKKILEELGYDFFDFDLWKAWLFLEESSAEVIIRDHLIRWFVPELKYELQTFSANSISKVEPKFENFNKLFVFLHLEPVYKNKVWVYIDAGDDEKEIISRMKSMYSKSGWNDSSFNQFAEDLDSTRKCDKLIPKEYLIRCLEIKAFSRA